MASVCIDSFRIERLIIGIDFRPSVALMARVKHLSLKLLNYSRLCYAGVRIYVNLTEFFLTW